MMLLGFYLNYFLAVADAYKGYIHKYVLVQVRLVHLHRFTHTTLIQPKKINQLYEAKVLDSIPMCSRERLVLISNTTGLYFSKKGLVHLLQLFAVFIYLHFISL